jgi:carboxymethylenebutenolidase
MMKALLAACCCVLLLACESQTTPGEDVESAVAATAAEHANDAPTASPLSQVAPERPVLGQHLPYGESGGSNLSGYLAMPEDAAEPLPGVVLVHEWWGLNDNIQAMSRRLAAQGYVVLAVDLYGGEIATTPAQAEALMTRTMTEQEIALDNIRQAYEYLNKYALAPSVGVMGWCLGGGLSLRAALAAPEQFDAAVMYYGQIVTASADLEVLDMPLLGLFGAEDASIPVRDVQRFRTDLRDLGKRAEILIYSDAGHAFANPSGGTYNATAADQAWEKTLEFLAANL